MKTDYTITPEYDAAHWESQARDWAQVYVDARRSHAAGEPLIRAVCKIATRILFVLMIVGIAVMVNI